MRVIICVVIIAVAIGLTEGFSTMAVHRASQMKLGVKLSPMVENMAISKTIEILGLTKELERQGKTVFSLCVGEPDYEPPEAVILATGAAARNGLTKYTAVNGELELRKAIAKDLTERKGTKYTADQIVVSNGAKQSVIQALLSTVSSGDKVLVPAPYWTSYPDMVKMTGAEPVFVHTRAEDGYELTAAALDAALKKHNPKALILCNPSNPTGCNIGQDRLRELVHVLAQYPDTVVISDEIYERLTYDNSGHVSLAALAPSPEFFDRVITVNGFSKSHAMTGYRVGYSASSTVLAKAMSKLQSQTTSAASSISQAAALAALTNPSIGESHWLENRVRELQAKRDLVAALVRDIPHVSCPVARGAFYLLPDVSAFFGTQYTHADGSVVSITDSHALCMALLKAEGVAIVAGDAFGASQCVRLSYATSETVLRESMLRLKRFLLALRKSKP